MRHGPESKCPKGWALWPGVSGHDLIDEYRLMVDPLVLGGGEKRLFRHAPKRTLELVDTLTFPTGVVVLTYRPA